MKKHSDYPELRLRYCKKHPMALKKSISVIRSDNNQIYEIIVYACGCEEQTLIHRRDC